MPEAIPKDITHEGADPEQPLDERTPKATLFRVKNASDAPRARIKPCAGPDAPYHPARPGSAALSVCAGAPDCADLEPGEAFPADVCSGPACAGPRLVLAPEEVDEVLWDGDYWEGGERGCRQYDQVADGTPLTTRICWGEPSGDWFDVVNFKCQEVSFLYGDALVEVRLD